MALPTVDDVVLPGDVVRRAQQTGERLAPRLSFGTLQSIATESELDELRARYSDRFMAYAEERGREIADRMLRDWAKYHSPEVEAYCRKYGGPFGDGQAVCVGCHWCTPVA